MSTTPVSSISSAKPDNSTVPLPHCPATGVADRKDTTPHSSKRLQNDPFQVRETDDSWIWEIIGIVGSALGLIGIAVLLHVFDGFPVPKWSYSYQGRFAILKDKAAHVSFNSILSILSTAVRILLLIPITRGLAQLKWVWMAEDRRILADLAYFEGASRGALLDSFKLVWRLKGR